MLYWLDYSESEFEELSNNEKNNHYWQWETFGRKEFASIHGE